MEPEHDKNSETNPNKIASPTPRKSPGPDTSIAIEDDKRNPDESKGEAKIHTHTHSLTIDRICRHYKSTRCERENREKILPVLPVNVRCFRVIEVIKIYLAPSHSHYGPTQHLSLEAKPRNYTECHLFRKWVASLCQLSSQRRPYKVHPDREEASSLHTIFTFRDLHGPCFR